MEKYLCGVDIGTTGTKCMVFDVEGKVIASGHREYFCSYPKPNWVEQDIELVISKTFEACKEVANKLGDNVKKIAAISFSTQRTTSIFLDENEKPIKTISWQDNRSVDEMKEIAKKINPFKYYNMTGLPLNTTWIITKILWMKNCEPQLWKKVKKVVQLQDYSLRQFGAKDYYVDYPDACLYGCFDTNTNQWNETLMNLINIKADILPIPTPCATKVCEISKKAASLSGFIEGTPICVGAGDQNSASIGAGIVNEGRVSVSLGTGGMAIAYLNYAYRDKLAKACVTCHAIKGAYQFEGYQTGAGSVYKWYKNEFAGYEKEDIIKGEGSAYDLINEQINKTPVGAKGILMLPYLASATSPRWNPNARGVILGLTLAHDRACVARACMEGITMEQKDILTNMKENGIKISSVRMIGGATKSDVWNQIQADMYNLPCETLRTSDAAVIGAAILGGVAVGVFNSISNGVESMVKIDKKFIPIEENVKIYDELYKIYCDTYTALENAKVFENIAIIQEKY